MIILVLQMCRPGHFMSLFLRLISLKVILGPILPGRIKVFVLDFMLFIVHIWDTFCLCMPANSLVFQPWFMIQSPPCWFPPPQTLGIRGRRRGFDFFQFDFDFKRTYLLQKKKRRKNGGGTVPKTMREGFRGFCG